VLRQDHPNTDGKHQENDARETDPSFCHRIVTSLRR
jgi:hypothetical protein